MSKKLVGSLVRDKLSGRKGIITEVIKEKKKKKKYAMRVWVAEQASWLAIECPRGQFEKWKGNDDTRIGFKKHDR